MEEAGGAGEDDGAEAANASEKNVEEAANASSEKASEEGATASSNMEGAGEEVARRRSLGERKRKAPAAFEAGSSTELTKMLRAQQQEREAAEEAQWAAERAVEEAANASFLTVSHAAAAGDVAAVKAWLDGGVGQVDARGGDHQTTLLMACSGAGSEPVVEYMVGRGADLDLQSSNGTTALMAAADGAEPPSCQCCCRRAHARPRIDEPLWP